MKKALCLGLAAALVCGLCGCAKEESSVQTSIQENTPEDSSIISQSTLSSVYESSVDSENMSESESLQKCEIELAGKNISLPCKVRDLQDITVDTEHPLVPINRENGGVVGTFFINYNDIRVGRIYLEGDCAELSDISEEKIIGLYIDDSAIPVSYTGLTLGSDEEEVKNTLGEYDKNVDIGSYYYIGSEGSVMFNYNSERKVRRIWLSLIFR